MAKKGPMPNFETVDDYINSQTTEAQKVLLELRSIIKEAVPEAVEVLNYKIPSFTLVSGGKRDQQIMMAAYAKFVGFYPFPTTMAEFTDELASYKQGKGSVQFPYNKPLPRGLIILAGGFGRALPDFSPPEFLKQYV
ncbi:iron chaperone [Owenweeksia hongkongensis]|uniref:iron chaperone n=1 Tax=Owenweeksia hongkongensis TaxID=253245 RepID=UPI003A95737E